MAEVALRAIEKEEHDRKEQKVLIEQAIHNIPYWVMEGAKNGGGSGD